MKLRGSCKCTASEANDFNAWMLSTVKEYETTNPSFWKLVVDEGVALVSGTECPGCSVSEEELAQFTAVSMSQEVPATAPAEVEDDDDDDDDNLFDSME